MSVWFKVRRPEILIITALLRAEGRGISRVRAVDLMPECGISKATLKRSLATLLELGLIEKHQVDVGRRAVVMVSLTERGRRVAGKFMEIERELLSNT